MASVTTTTTTEAPTGEYEKGDAPPPPPPPALTSNCGWDALLRAVLLAASVVAVVVMVTSNQTKLIPFQLPTGGLVLVPKSAKFHYSPAFIYFVAALSLAGLYSITTGLASLIVIWKHPIPSKCLLYLILSDVLILGIVASATGTAGSIAYLGLKGNSHVNWNKICDPYGKFCRYIGSSVAVSLFASIVLVLLIVGNAYALYVRVLSHPKSSA